MVGRCISPTSVSTEEAVAVRSNRCEESNFSEHMQKQTGILARDPAGCVAVKKKIPCGGSLRWVENKESSPCTNMKYHRNIKSYPNIDISRISNRAGIYRKLSENCLQCCCKENVADECARRRPRKLELAAGRNQPVHQIDFMINKTY